MMIGTQEHYDLMAAFERDHRGYRLDRETKDLWPKGHVYQNGETNALFLAYRNGAAFAKAYHRDESSTPANPVQVTDAMVEALAEFLCSEFDEDFNPCHGYSWPEHKDDDGYRGGNAYVKLQPSDVQARAREGATRILMFLSQRAALTAAIGAGGQAVAYQWRKRDRVMKHEEVWSYVDYHTGLKIAEHPEKYEVRPLYTHPAPSGQAVAVKPLEWYDPGNRIEYADTLLGSYKINASGSWWLDNGAMEHCGSREAAKAAAQADYKRRILSCLAAPVPATNTARPLNSGEVEALREALDFVNETSGAALGLAMSGDNHPNPDGVLMDISRKGMDLAPRLFAALSSAPSTPEGWRDMASAPTDGSRVICWNSEWETPESGCLYGFVWAANSLAANKGGWKYQPTNWMPLPTPPAGDGDA